MYTGFNVKINSNNLTTLAQSEYIYTGKNIKKKHEMNVHRNLDQILHESDVINGDLVQNLWFPQEIFGDENFIFISHSHKDEDLVIRLAGFLYEEFKIMSFIDSCVWLYSDTLNKKLNNCNEIEGGYCHCCNCNDFTKNIGYVHMMLASSIMAMIDKCECVFFLNTPSSINKNDKTESPWIYYELNIADIVKKESKIEQYLTEGVTEFICKSMEFSPKLNDMTPINEKTLMNWSINYSKTYCRENPFKTLYKTIGGYSYE